MDNYYEITNIDAVTKAIQAMFSYNGFQLVHTVFAEDITDQQAITQAVQDAYGEFKASIDQLQATPDLPIAVSALLNKHEPMR